MPELPRHSVSVTGIVVRDDGRILAIKRRDDGRWVPPGGVLELDESPADGVAREVLEETGVKVHAEELTCVYKNVKLGVVTLAFRCSVIEDQAHESDEAQRVAWLTVEEALEQMPEARAVRVTDAVSASSPPVRIHDGTNLLLERPTGRGTTQDSRTMTGLCEVVITAPDAEWLLGLTRRLVAEGLCASVHHFSPVRTIYLSHGEFVERTEARASLHTRAVLVDRIVQRVRSERPHEVPSITARAIIDGDRDYIRWMRDETDGTNDHLHGRRRLSN
jgi:8-oxo-dGTP diphosphatase